jgi:hypothetical protein
MCFVVYNTFEWKFREIAMKGIVGVFWILLFCTLGCQNTPTERYSNLIWGQPSKGLRCSIKVAEREWSKQDAAVVGVVIENISAGRVDLNVSSSFELSGEKPYWGPVNILGEVQKVPVNPRSTISLEKGESLSNNIDISKMGWDYTFSSVWPRRDFYSFVPVGRYNLTLDLEVRDGENPEHIVSNIVEVIITD